MNNKKYFEYLKKRSFLGYLYRKSWLYPKLNRELKGVTLDVGCGIGDMLSSRKHTIGVDINSLNIKFCRDRGCEAYLMSKNKLPFASHKFDSILLDNVLEHIQNPFPILKELKRVLKPGGVIVIGVPGIKGYEVDLDHKVFYDESALKKLAKKNGFKVTKYLYTPICKSFFLSRYIKQYCIYSIWR